jgi:hypothetical protein
MNFEEFVYSFVSLLAVYGLSMIFILIKITLYSKFIELQYQDLPFQDECKI